MPQSPALLCSDTNMSLDLASTDRSPLMLLCEMSSWFRVVASFLYHRVIGNAFSCNIQPSSEQTATAVRSTQRVTYSHPCCRQRPSEVVVSQADTPQVGHAAERCWHRARELRRAAWHSLHDMNMNKSAACATGCKPSGGCLWQLAVLAAKCRFHTYMIVLNLELLQGLLGSNGCWYRACQLRSTYLQSKQGR